jgi:hypothetical protein
MIDDKEIEDKMAKENSNSKPKFCPKCGENTKPNYKFCKNCGHQLIAFKQPEDEIEKNNKNFQIANEQKTENLPKGFKTPSSFERKDKSRKSLEKIIKLTKQNNTNLNVGENVEKGSDERSSLNVDGSVEKGSDENINRYSLADEILKFHELKEKRIITSEEFEKKKKQLLEL